MAIEKPFRDDDKFTRVHNYLFDTVMPSLKPNSWKVLCYVIRQTLGWKGQDGGRKQTDQLSYSQFREGTGIASDATLSEALKELLTHDLIKCKKGKRRDAHTYGLNLDYEIDTTVSVVHKKSSTTVSVEPITTVSVVLSTTETVETKERRKESIKENGGGIASTPNNPVSVPAIAAAVLKDLETTKQQKAQEVQANETAILSAFQRFNASIKEKGGGLKPITGTAKIARNLALRGETEATMKTAWDTCKANGIKPMGAFMKWIQEGYLPPQQEGHETKVVDGVVSVWVEGQGWMEIGGKAQ